ncbi:hypothetical protein BZB76_2555 [Actinomadura pelletieri DSM 43383]|uniref:Uncharacterized protein n=1 Tax=Actinomadura pelletieri DSM 43383 TaxID=1120940 RepID=A0A495QUP0_9ACTN|nr:hypothetical protein [Actinomadura pelletieri]RKS77178.1 hypothetical protein BZB76_2555 [Actinomadura pelletieri DSM 43383]
MSVVGGRETAETRRRHLAALAYEVEVRGLSWRLAGPEESLLSVSGPRVRGRIMVVATPSGDGWFYLWPGGGMADVAEVAAVADRLARMLA